MKKIIQNLILFLYNLTNLYIYFIVMACFLGVIPNINPNYPLFNYIFKIAGFYLIPPIFGFYLSPMLMLIVTTLIMLGLGKLYNKYFKPDEPKVIIMSQKDFIDTFVNKKEEERKDTDEK